MNNIKDTMHKIYNINILKLIIVLFPIIEIFSTMCENNEIYPTIGTIYKLLLIIYIFIYLIFFNKENKNSTYLSISILCITAIITFFTTLTNFEFKSIISKLVELSKYIAFPLYTIFFISYNKTENIKLPLTSIATAITLYSFVIFISYITQTYIPTYLKNDIIYGIKGWYNSANELGVILAIGYPILWLYIIKKPCISKYIALTICSFAMLNIATKAATLSILCTLICIIIFGIILNIQNKKEIENSTNKKYLQMSKNAINIALITLIISCIFLPKTPAYKYTLERYILNENTNEYLIEDMILNGRQYKLDEQMKIYNASNIINKLFGINNESKIYSSDGEYVIVERDFHDILFNYGIIGITVYITFLSIVMAKIIIHLYKALKNNNIKQKIKFKTLNLALATMLGFIAAFIAGHTISSTTVSLFLSLVLSTLYCIISVKEKDFENITNFKKNVMFISSVGGHLTQLLQLKSIFNDYNYVLITEKTDVTLDMKKKYKMGYLLHGTRHYMLPYIFKESYNLFKSIVYYFWYNPEVIVTTGTHTAVPMCYIAKIFGKKVIFIESFAKRNSPNKSGKMVYPIADVFVVQWESMKKVYPKAKVWGWIY